MKFLVAEDEPGVARTIRRALMPHGFVEVVETAADARERLAERSYDALVADVGLPDGSGLDLVAEATAEDDGLLALIVSGRVDPDRLAEAYQLGVSYLLKPVKQEELDKFAARVRQSLRPETRRGRIDGIVDEWTTKYALPDALEMLLRLSAHGVARADLAKERDVEPSTVKKQVQELLRRTGDATLDAAVSRLLREAVSPKR